MQLLTVFKSLAIAGLVSFPTLANADVISTPSSDLEIKFTGTVEYQIGNSVQVRNPDGSTVEFTRDAFGPVGPKEGEAVSVSYTFSADDPAFGNSTCGGSFALNTAQRSGPCTVTVSPKIVDSPDSGFQGFNFGGSGGDEAAFVDGLFLNVDPNTGAYSLAMPSGEYSVGYAAVRDYQYDSFTQSLTGPGFICVDAFSCPDDVAVGTFDRLNFPLQITGDLGGVVPGLNVGYDAGSAGFLSIFGGFTIGSGGQNPTPVPAPGMLLLFGIGVAAVFGRKHIGSKSRWA